MPSQQKTVGSIITKLINRVNSNMRRLRVIEQELSVNKSRMTSIEDESLGQKRSTEIGFKSTNDEMIKIGDRITVIENTLKEVITRLKNVTTTNKIRELEQLIEVYNPIKSQFVTREEVGHLIDEQLKQKQLR